MLLVEEGVRSNSVPKTSAGFSQSALATRNEKSQWPPDPATNLRPAHWGLKNGLGINSPPPELPMQNPLLCARPLALLPANHLSMNPEAQYSYTGCEQALLQDGQKAGLRYG